MKRKQSRVPWVRFECHRRATVSGCKTTNRSNQKQTYANLREKTEGVFGEEVENHWSLEMLPLVKLQDDLDVRIYMVLEDPFRATRNCQLIVDSFRLAI